MTPQKPRYERTRPSKKEETRKDLERLQRLKKPLTLKDISRSYGSTLEAMMERVLKEGEYVPTTHHERGGGIPPDKPGSLPEDIQEGGDPSLPAL